MVEFSEVEKIHELIRKFSPSTSMGDFGNKELLCIELLDWYKKQMVEKVATWLQEHVTSYADYTDWDECKIHTEWLVSEFKDSMGV